MIEQTAHSLAEQLEAGSLSAAEATQATLKRARETEDLGAFLHLDEEGALAQAKESDTRRAKGETRGPWDGVPVAVKDIFLTRDLQTTCASRILEGYRPQYDGTAVTKLREAGAVILGKLNMDEFAMGSSTEHSAFHPSKNPWDTARVPGGSSGGSAVAVAAGSAFATLGTDTGGSIRQPASFTGIVGLKPTYGRVSRFGVIAFASSLDQVGPMAKDVRDCASLLQVLAGEDARDATSAAVAVPDYGAELGRDIKGLRIGVPQEYYVDGVADSVRQSVEDALVFFEKKGAVRVPISLPHTEYAIPTYYVIATAEASSNLARYDGVRYGSRVDPGEGLNDMYFATRAQGFGTEVKRRIMLGTYVLSSGYYDAYYGKAQRVRTLVRQDFDKAFTDVDVIVTPTAPTTAFPRGDKIDDPVQMYLADIFTVGANLAGLPGISLPCGYDSDGLPMGLQILGPAWEEARILGVAHAYEQAHDWHTKRASL